MTPTFIACGDGFSHGGRPYLYLFFVRERTNPSTVGPVIRLAPSARRQQTKKNGGANAHPRPSGTVDRTGQMPRVRSLPRARGCRVEGLTLPRRVVGPDPSLPTRRDPPEP